MILSGVTRRSVAPRGVEDWTDHGERGIWLEVRGEDAIMRHVHDWPVGYLSEYAASISEIE